MTSQVRSILNELIAERAPWYFSGHPVVKLARRGLDQMLGYEATARIAEQLAGSPAPEIFREVGARLAQRVTISGLENVPPNGAALMVCNHPTGIADGLVLNHALLARRDDVYFFANRDIIRVFPQMDEKIAPVEWRPEKRSHAAMRDVIHYVRSANDAGRLGVIFPSGRLAKRRGIRLVERPWMPSAAMLARKFALPVIPVHITARNSALFYLFDLIHPTLRDITLFHETLNKDRFRFDIRIGRPVCGESLDPRSDIAIATLHDRVMALAGHRDQPLIAGSRRQVRAGISLPRRA